MPTHRSILLRDGGLTVGVQPACGGALTRFDVQRGDAAVEILRPVEEAAQEETSVLATACFPLIPYGGRLREGRFRFAGKEYRFPLNARPERHSSHGNGWMRSWELVRVGRRSVLMRLPADDSIPFRYEATQSIRIESNRVRIVLSARNLGGEDIPVGFGLHPYFAKRETATVTAALPLQWRWDCELMPVRCEANTLAAALGAGCRAMSLPVAAEYAGWDGRAIVNWPASGVRVTLTTAPPLSHVVVWAPEGEEFFCFEPMSHATDALNAYPGRPAAQDFVILAPGQVARQGFEFTVTADRAPR